MYPIARVYRRRHLFRCAHSSVHVSKESAKTANREIKTKLYRNVVHSCDIRIAMLVYHSFVLMKNVRQISSELQRQRNQIGAIDHFAYHVYFVNRSNINFEIHSIQYTYLNSFAVSFLLFCYA